MDIQNLKELLNEKNYEAAYTLAKKLEKQGNADGIMILSIMYHNGDYVEQDYKKEVELLKKAIKLGSLQAKFNLAIAMGVGAGIKQDAETGKKMINDLAKNNFQQAVDFLNKNN